MSTSERDAIYKAGVKAFYEGKPDDPPYGYGSDIQARCVWSGGYFDAKRGMA